MPQDTQVNDLKINVLSEAQYEQIQSPSSTELYLVPEIIDTTPTEDSTNPITSGAVYDALQNIPAQEQSDWNETDTTDPAFIKNKPNIPDNVKIINFTYNGTYPHTSTSITCDTSFEDIQTYVNQGKAVIGVAKKDVIVGDVHMGYYFYLNQANDYFYFHMETDNGFVLLYTDDVNDQRVWKCEKVDAIADWNETTSYSPSFIKNKPDIPIIVTLTLQNGEYIADKTPTEIIDGYNNGKKFLFYIEYQWQNGNTTFTGKIPLTPIEFEVDNTYFLYIELVSRFCFVGSYTWLYAECEVYQPFPNSLGFDVSPWDIRPDWTQGDTRNPGYIKNKPAIPTVNNATLTIKKNGTTIDTFSANSDTDKTIDISVPTNAADVSALPSSTKYAASLYLSVNSSTYVVTAQLKDQDGNNIGAAQTIDLPLESVVVSGSYNSQTKKVVLTLQNGSTIEFSVADLVAGLQSEITAQNPLSADLVTDGTNNKVFTAAEKTKLAGIEKGAEVNVQSDWNQSDSTADDYIKNKPQNIVKDANYVHTDNNYTTTDRRKLAGIEVGAEVNVQSDWEQTDNTADDFIKNKPTIPTVPTNVSAFTNDAGYITNSDLPTIDTALSETSTNPVQNQVIGVELRKLWNNKDIVSRLDNEYISNSHYITNKTGKWQSATGYKHWIIPVDGIKDVTIVANSSLDAYVAFLDTYTSTEVGTTPDYSSGWDNTEVITAGTSKMFQVPTGAAYMYLNTGNNNTAKASHIYATGIGITDEFELPSLDNNAGKVLAVNSGETDVEWTKPVTIYSGSSAPSSSTGSDGDIYIQTQS